MAWRSDDGVHAVAFRHTADHRLLGQILPVPHNRRGWIPRPGAGRLAWIVDFRLLLPAGGGVHVHAPGRTARAPRQLAQPGGNWSRRGGGAAGGDPQPAAGHRRAGSFAAAVGYNQANRPRSSTDRVTDFESGGSGFESLRGR